jgi:serine/threonine protein kinase
MSAQQFGRYIIKGELGRGGMATVFHAYDPRFERDVAIKVLPREFLHDPQFRVRFEREAKTIALIEHPAIVPVYDFGDEEGQPYIVMRYMSGGSLSERLAQGPLPTHEVINMVNRLAPALDAAHGKGIIHRDLKPANILYDQYGNSFLSDFGIARLQQATSATLTGGAILGTPAYMSPEQVQGGFDIDGRSDIYSLGVILYQILTGKVPYQADTAAKMMMMHILEPVPQITDAKEDIPAAFDDVIKKAMAKEPNERYQTTIDMARAVEQAARGSDMPTIIGESSSDASNIPTNLRPAATVYSPTTRKKDTRANAATRAGPAPTGAAKATGQVAQPVVAPHRRTPTWVWLTGGVILAGILIASFALGGGMLIRSSRGTSTLLPTSPVAVAVADTPSPSNTPFPTIKPTETPTPTRLPTDTPAPTSTDTPPPATDTPTPLPLPPVIGGADKLAFVSNNDVYIVNLDGTDLVRLTSDGGAKSHLQWTPDGSGLAYITGLCIKVVDFETTRIDDILCFEYAISLDAFEISPDGQQLAIVVNQYLYVVPLDFERLAQVGFWDDIQAMATCEGLAPYASSTGAPYAVREVHWSNDQQNLALIVPIPVGGIQVEVVRVVNISQCVNNPPRVDEFPSTRFDMAGYDDNPNLLHVGYDGQVLFALTTIVRNEGFGDLYLYNMDVHRAQARVNPIGGRCCYRDPEFSPDGSYFVFAFQDIGLGSQSTIELYYIPFGTLSTGLTYTPIPLPAGIFTNQRESPQPVLRPVLAIP